jgi:tetratricopeptide (TPR) repeat protein
LEEALKHYNLAVSNDPNHSTYYFNRGLCKSRLDKVDEAIEDFTASINHNSENKDQVYNCRFNRGICYRRQGNLEKSIEDFKKAIDTKGEKASAYNNLGLSYFENEEFEEALNNY